MKTLIFLVRVKKRGQKLFVFIKKENEEFCLFFIKRVVTNSPILKNTKPKHYLALVQDLSEQVIRRLKTALFRAVLSATKDTFEFEFKYS
jgi:hypothetical protein